MQLPEGTFTAKCKLIEDGDSLVYQLEKYFTVECQNICPDGETWDEECQECICELICNGTIASIIRSIVL